MKYFVFYNNDAQISNEDAAVLLILGLAIFLFASWLYLKELTMNRESLLDILLFVGRIVGWLLIIAGNIISVLAIAHLLTPLFP